MRDAVARAARKGQGRIVAAELGVLDRMALRVELLRVWVDVRVLVDRGHEDHGARVGRQRMAVDFDRCNNMTQLEISENQMIAFTYVLARRVQELERAGRCECFL